MGWKGASQIVLTPSDVQIIEAPHQSFEIADAIAVGIHEGLQIQAVDDRVFVPEIFDHGCTAIENCLSGCK